MKTAINVLRPVVELGHECQTFAASTVFKSLPKTLKKLEEIEIFEFFQQIQLTAKNFFMAVFMDIWPCFLTNSAKLSCSSEVSTLIARVVIYTAAVCVASHIMI